MVVQVVLTLVVVEVEHNTEGTGGAGGSGIVIIRYLTYGTLYLGATNTSSADLAEYYVSGDKNIEAGTWSQ